MALQREVKTVRIYFMESATADNYIAVETSEGVRFSNCAPDGRFAGVSLQTNDERKAIDVVFEIVSAIDENVSEDDMAWMGEPVCSSMDELKSEIEAQEPFNRDSIWMVFNSELGSCKGGIHMKAKITSKQIRAESVYLVSVGYCDLQWLLSRHEPLFYNCGVYGWNYDVYEVYGVTICTGYRGMPKGIKLDYETAKSYEEEAEELVKHGERDRLENLLMDFCDMVKQGARAA